MSENPVLWISQFFSKTVRWIKFDDNIPVDYRYHKAKEILFETFFTIGKNAITESHNSAMVNIQWNKKTKFLTLCVMKLTLQQQILICNWTSGQICVNCKEYNCVLCVLPFCISFCTCCLCTLSSYFSFSDILLSWQSNHHSFLCNHTAVTENIFLYFVL